MSAEPNHRLLSVTTPLGPDAFLLTGFSGVEGLSRLFRFELELLSEKEVAVGALVGGPIAWAVHSPGRPPRFFHGVVRRFAAAGRQVGAYRTYRAAVVPWVWALTRGAECRAFADRTLPEIVEDVFHTHGFTDYELALSRTYPRRDHRIQYRESPFGFVSRLLEEDGAYYFFRCEEGTHRLVIADDPTAYRDCEEHQPRLSPGVVGRDRISEWEHRCEVSTGAWTPIDEDLVGQDSNPVLSNDRIGILSHESIHEIMTGAGGCCSFMPGGKFTLENTGCVVVAVEHEACDSSFTPSAGGKSYTNRFTCIPDATTFLPRPTTSRPSVPGPQTAVVAGPQDGEPCLLEDGRIAVRFLWGRERRPDKESCRIRIAKDERDGDDALRPRVGQEIL
ncbi:MAG TPA: contractile injection system protein, VgrG/Pvc8 family, partial [Gemmataceae bacterium]|nr:contractile injection system protein, VgrG/Pvc8 family [Gemmataceae bacterium]